MTKRDINQTGRQERLPAARDLIRLPACERCHGGDVGMNCKGWLLREVSKDERMC